MSHTDAGHQETQTIDSLKWDPIKGKELSTILRTADSAVLTLGFYSFGMLDGNIARASVTRWGMLTETL